MGLFRVRNEAGTIGCDQVLIDNNRACLYQGGRTLPADHRISTGVIVDYLLIEECCRREIDAVDFLAGDTPHKRRLSTHSTPLIWAVIRRPRLKHRLINGLRYIRNVVQQKLLGKGAVQMQATEIPSQPDGFAQ
jgi:CelD/BcsL family acetyltransferase involved in cellulose biosynthesis